MIHLKTFKIFEKLILVFFILTIACSLNSEGNSAQNTALPYTSDESADLKDIKTAIKEKDYVRLEKLLEAKPNLDVRNEKEISLLQETLNFDLKSAEILLKAGANPDFESLEIGCGTSERCLKRPLYIAFKRNDAAKLKLLLKHDADPNKDSLLAWAVSRNQTENVSLLISHKADVNYSEDFGEPGQTPIFFAETEEIANILIKNGANINQVDQKGFTPLMSAVENQNLKLVQALLKNNADVNIKNPNGQSSLQLAEKSGNKSIIKLLKQSGAK